MQVDYELFLLPQANQTVLTIRNVNHDSVANGKQKEELVYFGVLSSSYLLYQVVIIEGELPICIHVPAEIHLLLGKQSWSHLGCHPFGRME